MPVWSVIRELANQIRTDADVARLVKSFSETKRASIRGLLELILECLRNSEARKYLLHAMTLVVLEREQINRASRAYAGIEGLIIKRPRSLVIEFKRDTN